MIRLRHPNVAQIFFIGQDRGFHFFVMEYLEGPGLDALLAKTVVYIKSRAPAGDMALAIRNTTGISLSRHH